MHLTITDFSLKEIADGIWHVDSVSGATVKGYTIVRCQTATCDQCALDGSICTAPECGSLCIHMYKCGSACYSFNNGHICKHIHRVHSLLQLKQPLDEQTGPIENKHTTDDFGEVQHDSEDVKPMNVIYADSALDSCTGIQTKFYYSFIYNISTYLLCIQ